MSKPSSGVLPLMAPTDQVSRKGGYQNKLTLIVYERPIKVSRIKAAHVIGFRFA